MKVKKNEKIIIVILCALAVILTVILICMLSCGGGGVIEDTLVSPAPTELDPGSVVVHDPGANSTTVPEQGGTTGEIVIWLDDPVPTNAPVEAGATAAPGADPVSGQAPDDDGPGGPGGHGQGNTGEYHCGTPGHHCDSPETHAYILNLEAQGCPYCGRHDCPSFYAVDEWGTACYDPTKCPQYDVHLDPVYYCQHCHKPCGDGTNGTCVRFVNACHCPICGKWVEAFTCHSCEQ